MIGKGCPKCSGKNKTTNDVINQFQKIHGNKYDYSKFRYENAITKSEIVCPKHGSFYQNSHSHLFGYGCPYCVYRISKPEIEFLNYLNINKFNRQLKINRKLVDGIKGNTIYEFLGDFWHGNPQKFKDNDIHPYIKKTYKQIRETTFTKLKYLKSLGYNVKYIWEADWKIFKSKLVNHPNIQTL